MNRRVAVIATTLTLSATAIGVFVATTQQGPVSQQPSNTQGAAFPRPSEQEATIELGAESTRPPESFHARRNAMNSSAAAARVPTDRLISDFRSAYRDERVVSQFRIQAKIQDAWESEPPAIDDLEREISDESAPAAFRLSLARALRNLIAQGVFGEDDIGLASEGLRRLVTDPREPEFLRAQISDVLTEFDQSDETIRAVAMLLDSSDDRVAAHAVSALSNTTSPLAEEQLFLFAQKFSEVPGRYPTAIIAALAPLSSSERYEISPLVRNVIVETRDPKTLVRAVSLLGHIRSSLTALEAISEAYETSHRFPTQQRRVRRLCQLAVDQHARFIETERDQIRGDLLELLERVSLGDSVSNG